MNYPRMYRIRQTIDAPEIDNIENTITQELGSLELASRITPGARVAITAGSRGINHIDRILKQVIHILKSYKARPFIVPAMGSHGNGTAQGQLEILKSLNISKKPWGYPFSLPWRSDKSECHPMVSRCWWTNMLPRRTGW